MSSKFTPQLRALLLAGLRTGLTLSEACDDVAVAPNTVKSWLQRGRRETGTEHAAFAEAVDLAREAAATATMDQTEFLSHVNASVRRGSVTAMRLWWAIHQADDDDADAASELDELDGESVIDRLARQARERREHGQ
jgi:transposase-like protein